ncbi:MAG TPA: hypothetical protein VD907_05295 [Verrucomicrobiae bacterium]|nr:hypothetical protein [Verrucomicrobiae bacterium]
MLSWQNKVEKQRGDTIIEVLFATAALSFVIVLSFMIMNKGIASVQIAVEDTLARQAIDAQAESLRYLRDAYVKTSRPSGVVKTQWEAIVARKVLQATAFKECELANIQANKAFFINTNNVTVQSYNSPALTFAGAELGQGIWVEAVQPNIPANKPKYIDFHIRACWEPPTSGPNITIGTIVRLYES